MKSMDWLPLIRTKTMRVFFSFALVAFLSACADDAVDYSAADADAAARKNKAAAANGNSGNGNSNSQSSAGDYNIAVSRTGAVWTYVITKNAGAKDLSHFILDLNNCEKNQTLTFSSITSATVNGQPAIIESSTGNTACDLTTNNFIKFDDLPEADVYTIVFTLDAVYNNFLTTTAWLKAGTTCHAYYDLKGPCCLSL